MSANDKTTLNFKIKPDSTNKQTFPEFDKKKFVEQGGKKDLQEEFKDSIRKTSLNRKFPRGYIIK